MISTTTALARGLADPTPPVPGAEARAAVARRSTSLRRRRRLGQCAGALACVAVLAGGVVAVTQAGSATHDTVEAAAGPTDAHVAVSVGDEVVPAGVELDATLVGDAGTYRAHVRTPGTLAFDEVAPGDYELRWTWANDDGTASASGRMPVEVTAGDVSLTL